MHRPCPMTCDLRLSCFHELELGTSAITSFPKLPKYCNILHVSMVAV